MFAVIAKLAAAAIRDLFRHDRHSHKHNHSPNHDQNTNLAGNLSRPETDPNHSDNNSIRDSSQTTVPPDTTSPDDRAQAPDDCLLPLWRSIICFFLLLLILILLILLVCCIVKTSPSAPQSINTATKSNSSITIKSDINYINSAISAAQLLHDFAALSWPSFFHVGLSRPFASSIALLVSVHPFTKLESDVLTLLTHMAAAAHFVAAALTSPIRLERPSVDLVRSLAHWADGMAFMLGSAGSLSGPSGHSGAVLSGLAAGIHIAAAKFCEASAGLVELVKRIYKKKGQRREDVVCRGQI